MYDAGPGVKHRRVDYRGARTGASWASFQAATFWICSDTTDVHQLHAWTSRSRLDDVCTWPVPDNASRAGTRFCSVVISGAVTPAAGHQRRFDIVNVFGNHGLPRHSRRRTGLGGMRASRRDHLADRELLPRPQRRRQSKTRSYGIGHLVFRDRTYPYDAMLLVNSFHRWGLECWEGGTVHYGPLDLTDYDWELRLDDFGTQLSPQGPVAEEVANGIEVQYTDAKTGRQEVLLPDDWPELRDTNPLNPVNRAGGL